MTSKHKLLTAKLEAILLKRYTKFLHSTVSYKYTNFNNGSSVLMLRVLNIDVQVEDIAGVLIKLYG
jgi:hypothetical protein